MADDQQRLFGLKRPPGPMTRDTVSRVRGQETTWLTGSCSGYGSVSSPPVCRRRCSQGPVLPSRTTHRRRVRAGRRRRNHRIRLAVKRIRTRTRLAATMTRSGPGTEGPTTETGEEGTEEEHARKPREATEETEPEPAKEAKSESDTAETRQPAAKTEPALDKPAAFRRQTGHKDRADGEGSGRGRARRGNDGRTSCRHRGTGRRGHGGRTPPRPPLPRWRSLLRRRPTR